MPGHWVDSAPTPAERARRRAALDRLALVRDGYRVYDGPVVLDLIRRWDKAFAWEPGRDRGVLVTDWRGLLIDRSTLVGVLLRP